MSVLRYVIRPFRPKSLINPVRSITTSKYNQNEAQLNSDDEKDTHFGFTCVKESQKAQKVHDVFENVAHNYDIMNDAMSLGIHRLWKDYFIQKLQPGPNTKLLDMAGGTGDIAFRYIQYLQSEGCAESSHVTVSDINEHMLKVGEERAKDLGIPPQIISWKQEDAEKLSFPDDSFHAYTIAFGVRNVTHIDKVLSEAYRVLAPGGRFMCLEFSQIASPLQWIYDQYSFQVIPVMGHLLAGQWSAYQYLVESIRKFPDQERFKHMIQEAGFRSVTYENLSMGICAIHSGFKI